MSSTKLAPPPVLPHFFPNEKLAFISFIVLSAAVVLYALFTIPHAIARFSAKSAWKQGSLLFYSPSETRGPREYLEGFHRGPFIEKDAALRQGGTASTLVRIPRYSPQDSQGAPPHLPSWDAMLYPFSSLLSPRFFGYSLSQLLILFSYAVLFGVLLLIYSDPVSVGEPS
jgi:ferric-chelate reductase